MRVVPLTSLVLVCSVASSSAQSVCTNVGSERWAVKTSAPRTTRAKTIDLVAFGQLPKPQDITTGHDNMLNTRYPTAIRRGLHEGDLVRVTGWVQKVKTSPDDCDYHIEITADSEGQSGMIIVEVPEPDADHVASDASLRAKLESVRESLTTGLQFPHEPSSSGFLINGKAYMTFTGALFFDAPHVAQGCKRGTGSQNGGGSKSCWEIHPVTAVKFAVRPK